MANAVVKCLKHINEISISNLIQNANSLLSRREVEVPIDWVGENKKRIPPQKFKVSSQTILLALMFFISTFT